jgi:putative protease
VKSSWTAATSEEGISASVTLNGPFGVANKPEQALEQLHDLLGQLGTTNTTPPT